MNQRMQISSGIDATSATTDHGDGQQTQDAFSLALATQSKLWPDVTTGHGPLEDGWRTAKQFFEDDGAIAYLLEHERSLNEDTDAKASAAFLMTDYCHVFTAATVPLLAGFGIVADFSLQHFALKFYMEKHEHRGRIYDLPRAHVRYLSDTYYTDRNDAPLARNGHLVDHDQLCDQYRQSTENHFHDLIGRIASKTGLGRNALWRLVGDAIAARFLEAGRQLDCLEQAKATAMAILKYPGSPLNNRQLHYFDLSVLDRNHTQVSHTFRARGGCCRFYSVKEGKYCATCVLKDPIERDEQLQAAMRHHLGVA